jgi:hypothetical protein
VTSALVWMRVFSFKFKLFYPQENSQHYPLDGRLSWPQICFWTAWRLEKSSLYWDSNSDPSVVHPVASRYTDRAIPAVCSETKEGAIVLEMLP